MTEALRSIAPLRAQPRRLSDGVFVIKCVGQLRAKDAGYLPDLAKMMAAQPERALIVFDTLDLEGYSPEFPLSHIPFFTAHRERIARIAVAHELKSIAFAVVTVALASNTSIKGFSSMADALAWVRGH